ncbi:N-alpha-acetyltransferase 60 isoform X2 [Octopus bimaculoides]|uniref:N-alpha-acetyltransferase 60 isoform X2 n=1 Tax=Octopus bimaculoides TaxID=37653 RepID=UPI0022E57D38|nr:N-alpha-acetyltransferase 60 isoform X2 [Octopus bimaculoides]
MNQAVSFGVQREVQLRFLCPDDIEEVKRLCTEWFPIEYPDSWYQDITSNAKFYSLAATYYSRIIGLIVAEVKSKTKLNREDADILATHYPTSCQVAYILSLGVVDEFRRHGIASLLLDSLLSYLTSRDRYNCKAIYLHVLTTNSAAICFYERRNFQPHSYLPYYYSINSKPHDGYSYVLYINGGQPPWSIYDYLSQCGALLAKIHPCLLSQQILQAVQKWLRRLLSSSSYDSQENHANGFLYFIKRVLQTKRNLLIYA